MKIFSFLKKRRKILFLVSLPQQQEFQKYSKEVDDCIVQLKQLGVDAYKDINPELLSTANRYDFVIVVAHLDESSHLLILENANMSMPEFVGYLPNDFKGLLDFSSCYSANSIEKIKSHCPECHVLGALQQTTLAVRLIMYPHVVKLLNDDKDLDYRDAYATVLDQVARQVFENRRNERNKSGERATKLGEEMSSVYSPQKVKCEEPFLIQVFFHKDSETDEVALIAQNVQDGSGLVHNEVLPFHLNMRDRIMVNLSFMGKDTEMISVDSNTKTAYWMNSKVCVQFCVNVDKDYCKDKMLAKLTFEVNTEPIGECYFQIQVTKDSRDNAPASIQLSPYNKAEERNSAKAELIKSLQKNIEHLDSMLSDFSNPDSAKPIVRDKVLCQKCLELILCDNSIDNHPPKVFVSSTSDMAPYREIARQTIKDLGFEPEMYEDWEQTGLVPRDECCRRVLNSDVFLCILGGRYGFVERSWNMSMTEIEYRVALLAGKKILIFVIDPLNETDEPDDITQRQLNLIDKVKLHRILRIFDSKDDFQITSKNDLKRI